MKYKTKDSGQRQEYNTGMVRDVQDGKPDFSLLLPEGIPYKDQCLTRWAELMERGRIKYGLRNWEKASTEEELQRFRASAMRHFMQWYCGETDEDHLAATWFNMQAVEFVNYKQVEFDYQEIEEWLKKLEEPSEELSQEEHNYDLRALYYEVTEKTGWVSMLIDSEENLSLSPEDFAHLWEQWIVEHHPEYEQAQE